MNSGIARPLAGLATVIAIAAVIVIIVFAVIYQQIENLTIEPRISARAVDVHPAVAFAAVMLGLPMPPAKGPHCAG